MKKRVLLISLLAVMLIAAFAIVISAADNVIKLSTIPTLEEIHANPSAYVSHLNAFDSSTYKELDADSVVVLSDAQSPESYYVFPSYYVIESTSMVTNVTNLNAALAVAAEKDSTIFSSFKDSGSRGGNPQMIRLEVPTYVTTMSAWAKFEDSYKLIELYFPTKTVIDEETGEEKTVACLTTVKDANTFTNCYALEVIHNYKYLPVGIINGGSFSNCRALKELDLPQGITSVPDGLFSGCYALESIVVPDGVTSIGKQAFYYCSSIKELILPNSVVSIGKNAFSGMTSLEKLSFGANCTTLTGTDGNCEIIPYSLTKLKYVYMPAKFASQVGDESKNYYSIFTLSSKHIIFFTGTQADFQRIIDFAKSYSSTTSIQNATFDEYNPQTNYNEDYYNSRSGITVVCNYNLCEAFYESEHVASGEVKTSFAGEDFLSVFTAKTGCGRECGKETVLDTFAPLFIDRGFSYGPNSMLQGVAVDRELLDEYGKYFTGIKYGLVAAAKSAQASASIIDANGVGANGYVAAVDYTERDYDLFEMNLCGISEDYQQAEFYFGAYVIADGQVYYIHNGTTNNEAQAITYDDVVVIVDALVPENKEDGDNA